MKRSLEAVIALALICIFVKFVLFADNVYSFAIGLFFFMPFSSFAIAPLMRVESLFKFYSKLLLVQFPRRKVFDLHLANNYDLVIFSISNVNARKMVFLEIVKGLLNICKEVEDRKLPRDLNIQAITFFLNKRSFRKLGFRTVKASPQYALLYAFDYIGILIANYFMTKRLRFVNILKTRKASMTAQDLLGHKRDLERLRFKLNKDSQSAALRN